jgi:hypothetical protein
MPPRRRMKESLVPAERALLLEGLEELYWRCRRPLLLGSEWQGTNRLTRVTCRRP